MARKSMKRIRGGDGENNNNGYNPAVNAAESVLDSNNTAGINDMSGNAGINDMSGNAGMNDNFTPEEKDPYARLRGGRRRKSRRANRKNRSARKSRANRCMYRKSRRLSRK
jgi:hypothetical protein